ncbi:hypothetical protein CMV_011098 [Castanea mollissima]|uniref:Rab-GAP TBC domain-containing protein n=1 Tax=Castanea mollissima TaxID=60419 RepID=A0A8J4VX74_9ROSI|nr:hypothetical protein CMV_011098 [Castanea mollissima]
MLRYFKCNTLPGFEDDKSVGLPLVEQYLFQFDQLVREHLPELGEHFTQEVINPSMYASQWFINVFSYSSPFHLALRIWDVFLYEGVKIVYKINLPFEKLIHALRNFLEDAVDPNTLLPMASTQLRYKHFSHYKGDKLLRPKPSYKVLKAPYFQLPHSPINFRTPPPNLPSMETLPKDRLPDSL